MAQKPFIHFKENDKTMNSILLKAENLSKSFPDTAHFTRTDTPVLDHLSFEIRRGEILGLLGESGCGKTTLARILMGTERADHGSIWFHNTDLCTLPPRKFRTYRKQMQMIFQNPFASFDPCMEIGRSLAEPLRLWNRSLNRAERQAVIAEICQDCSIDPDSLFKKPGEFSGGQLQRISIARSLITHPEFLIADEVVSALDVPRQEQILALLLKMREKYGLTILFITHDLAVMKKVSDRNMVMQGGRIIQSASPSELFDCADPYVAELKDAVYTF